MNANYLLPGLFKVNSRKVYVTLSIQESGSTKMSFKEIQRNYCYDDINLIVIYPKSNANWNFTIKVQLTIL